MKALIFPLLLCAGFAQATSDLPFQRYQCDEGVSVEARLVSPSELDLRLGWTVKRLNQVVAASGAKYSDSATTFWLKGDQAMYEHNQDIKNCTLAPSDEPLTPIRDAASGLIFVPPERWTADKVKLSVKSGDDIPFYGKSATHQFEYRYNHSSDAPLLDILVFPKVAFAKLGDKAPKGEKLGEDTQRVYIAQLPANNPFDPNTPDGKAFIGLQTNSAELKQAFSMYGVVQKAAVESVTVKVMWLERRLYPGTTLTVTVQDVSKMDAPAEIIAKQVIKLDKGTPPTVTLKFAPEAINPKHRYSIGARLEMDGKLIKINDTHTAVLTQGAGREAEVILKSITE